LLKLFFLSSFSVFEAELAETIPVIHASLAGCRIIGRMSVGKMKYYFHPN
jgi:hypothetical protein